MPSEYSKEDIEFHGEPAGFASTTHAAINIKVYANANDVTFPLSLGMVNDEEVFTDKLFNHDWVEKNVSGEQNEAFFWQCCEDFVEDFMDKASKIFPSHIQFWIEGRQGGWLVSSFTKEEVLESWAVQELNKWRKLEAYCHHAKAKFWERFMVDLYVNMFDVRKERAKEENKRCPEMFQVIDSDGNSGWAIGPFDEEIELDAPEVIIQLVRDLFIWDEEG